MFVVTIDIWPHGRADMPQTQLAIVAANDGSEHGRWGSYDAITVDDLDLTVEENRWTARTRLIEAIRAGETARVEHFPRGHTQSHLASLTAALIEALGLGEYVALPE